MPGVGTRVVATISIDESALTFDLIDGKLSADVDIGGICYDDKGNGSTALSGVSILPRSSNESRAPGSATKPKRSIYRFSTMVPGGLYQVRVGIRDLKSSRLGSAIGFDHSTKTLIMMNHPHATRILITLTLLLAAFSSTYSQTPPSGADRENARSMLNAIKSDLQKYYYDPQFRGMNLDERFKAADEKRWIKPHRSLNFSGSLARCY